MPISISEYHKGLDSEENRVLAILEKQPYEAHDLEDLLPYKEENVSKVLFIVKRLLGLESTLKGLVEKGLVRSRVVNGTVYYVCSNACH